MKCLGCQEKLQLCWICSLEVNLLLCLCFFSFMKCKLHWFQFVGQLGLVGSENICLKQRSKGGWDVTHRKLTDQFNCCEMWSASFLHPNCILHTPTQTTPTAMQTSQLKIGKEGATESQMEQMSNIKSLANGIHILPTLNKDFQGNLHVCYLEFFNVSLIM